MGLLCWSWNGLSGGKHDLIEYSVLYERCVHNLRSGDRCIVIKKIFHLLEHLPNSVDKKKVNEKERRL